LAKAGRVWFGVVVTLLFLALFLYKVDWREAVVYLRQANYVYVVPAIAVYFLSVYFRTLRWQFLLGPMKTLSIARLYPVVVVGYMANNLLHVRMGEVVRYYYLSRREGVSDSGSLATIVVERVFDGLTILALAAVVSVALPVLGVVQGLAEQANSSPLLLALAVPLLFVGVAATLLLMASAPGLTIRIASRMLRLVPSSVGRRLEPLALRFLEGLATLRSPGKVLALFLLSWPIWLAEAAMYLILSYSFQVDQAFGGFPELAAAILLLTAVSNLATSLPSSPGGVGPFEFFAKGSLVLLGVGTAQATAYVGVLHLALLAPVTVAGLVVLRAGRLTLGELTREMQARGGPAQKAP
jgi:hypothetical protein